MAQELSPEALEQKQKHDEAVAEITEVEQLIRDTYEEPPQFMIG